MNDNKGVVNIKGKQYQTVALRVHKFRESHRISEGWAIITDLHACDEKKVIIKASIVSPEGITVATGWAHETWTGQINKFSAVENGETSAIGRALANCGLGGEHYASADEMENALHKQKKGPKFLYDCATPESLMKLLTTRLAAMPIDSPESKKRWEGAIKSVTEAMPKQWDSVPIELNNLLEDITAELEDYRG